jgi:hypothetical protein
MMGLCTLSVRLLVKGQLQRVVVRDEISFNFSPLVYTTQREALETGKRWVRAGN